MIIFVGIEYNCYLENAVLCSESNETQCTDTKDDVINFDITKSKMKLLR